MNDGRRKNEWPEILLAGRPEAPALAEWILRMNETADGLSAVPRVSAMTGISEPTLRSGGPVGLAKRRQLVNRLEASLQRRLTCASGKNIELAAHVHNAAYPPTFALFAGGYSKRMLEICDALDLISERVATCVWSKSDAARAIADVGAAAAPRKGLSPVVDELVALEATLLVLTCLDMEVLLNHHDCRYPVQSLFQDVHPIIENGRVKRWPYARLLDRLYLLITDREGQARKKKPPTIVRLDAALGTASAGGTPSPVRKWRNGRRMLRSSYADIVNMRLPDGPERFIADKLYAGATFWHVLLINEPQLAEWALQRFDAWWSCLRPEDFVDGPEGPVLLNASP